MNLNQLTKDSKIENLNSFTDANMLVKIGQLLYRSQPPRPVLSKVFNFIEENYQNQISLREVAKEVGRSPAYLTDFVRRKTGKTVLSWITERRMAEARKLLLETDQSIEQISEAVGYFDRRHFGRLFLRTHQSTPQAWRTANQSCNDLLLHTNKQKTADLTTKEAQKLKICVREIAAILYKNTSADEMFNLEKIEGGSILQIYDGSIQVILK